MERSTAVVGEAAEEFDLGEIPGRAPREDEMPLGWDRALELLGTGEGVDAVSSLTISPDPPKARKKKRQVFSVRPCATGPYPFGLPAKEARSEEHTV